MTNSTAGVRLGGSGYSYGDYSLPNAKKPVIDEDDAQGSNSKSLIKKDSKQKEIEIFLFTIKDPIKTVISKLMDLISVYENKPIPQIDIKLAETGPMGYTTLFAQHPTLPLLKPAESLIKPVIR